MRRDGRAPDELRPVEIELDFTENPRASVLCEWPHAGAVHRRRRGVRAALAARARAQGWVTAEYSMLPGATDARAEREARAGGPRAARRRSSA